MTSSDINRAHCSSAHLAVPAVHARAVSGKSVGAGRQVHREPAGGSDGDGETVASRARGDYPPGHGDLVHRGAADHDEVSGHAAISASSGAASAH